MLRFRAQGLRHHRQVQMSLGLAVARHLRNLWDDVVENLAEVKILHGNQMFGEARGLENWIRACLECSGKDTAIQWTREPSDALEGLDCRWTYSDKRMGKSIHIKFSKDLCQGDVAMNLGRGPIVHPIRLKKPSHSLVLAEALFF